jgi:hypothetical protein
LSLTRTILDCAGGPASVNAEVTRKGYTFVSCDPLYRFTAEEIAWRIEETYETILAGAKTNRHRYAWDEIESLDRLGEVRMATMRRFLDNFPRGISEKRYRTEELPTLGFEHGTFDPALCSHFPFTYSEQLSADSHVSTIEEMCRVAYEARVFPLLDYAGEPSSILRPVVGELRARGYRSETRRVAYEFQRGRNRLLSVSSAAISG